jgi:hypothetical protein
MRICYWLAEGTGYLFAVLAVADITYALFHRSNVFLNGVGQVFESFQQVDGTLIHTIVSGLLEKIPRFAVAH